MMSRIMTISVGDEVFDADGASYEVKSRINSGGFGTVWKIQQDGDSTTFALKSFTYPNPGSTTRFSLENEALAAAPIVHKNVINYIFFHDGNSYAELPPYIIMEYAPDGSLRDRLDERNRSLAYFTNSDLINYFSQLVDGMEEINSRLVHRDIKPGNILIDGNCLKISDFGLAKFVEEETRSNTMKSFGTDPYKAPEAWKGLANTPLMDMYSMGIVFYEMACLRLPFEVGSDGFVGWENAHLFTQPRAPSNFNAGLTPSIDQLVLKMIEKDPRARFDNWDAIRERLLKLNDSVSTLPKRIDGIIRKVAQKDNEDKGRKLNKLKEQENKKDYTRLVMTSFVNRIVIPLRSDIEQVNEHFRENPFLCEESNLNDHYSCSVKRGFQELFSINLEVLHDDEYPQELSPHPFFGESEPQYKFERPKWDNKFIMAWGIIRMSDRTGENLLLLEEKDNPYGSWHLLRNENNAGTMSKRLPEPFAFEFDELREEIRDPNQQHIYVSKVVPLDTDHFSKLLEKCFDTSG